jgi:hypothetical protein
MRDINRSPQFFNSLAMVTAISRLFMEGRIIPGSRELSRQKIKTGIGEGWLFLTSNFFVPFDEPDKVSCDHPVVLHNWSFMICHVTVTCRLTDLALSWIYTTGVKVVDDLLNEGCKSFCSGKNAC